MVDKDSYTQLLNSISDALREAPIKRDNPRKGKDFIINNNELIIQNYGTYIMLAVFTGHFEPDDKPSPFYKPDPVETKRFISDNGLWVAIDGGFKKVKPAESYSNDELAQLFSQSLLQLPEKVLGS